MDSLCVPKHGRHNNLPLQLLRQRGYTFSVEISTINVLSKMLVIYTTINMPTGPQSFPFAIFSKFLIFFFEMISHILIYCIYLNFIMIMHLFLCLLAICICFSVNSHLYISFFSYPSGYFGYFFLLVYRSSLCMIVSSSLFIIYLQYFLRVSSFFQLRLQCILSIYNFKYICS